MLPWAVSMGIGSPDGSYFPFGYTWSRYPFRYVNSSVEEKMDLIGRSIRSSAFPLPHHQLDILTMPTNGNPEASPCA